MFQQVSKNRHRTSLAIFLATSALFFYLAANPLKIEKLFEPRAGQAVGMLIGVEENPYNKAATQLERKAEQLDQKERSLTALQLQLENNNRIYNKMLAAIFIFVLVLTLLIGLNFLFDYKRKKYA